MDEQIYLSILLWNDFRGDWMKALKGCWVADSQQMEARLQMVNVSQAAEALSSDSIQSPPFFIFW